MNYATVLSCARSQAVRHDWLASCCRLMLRFLAQIAKMHQYMVSSVPSFVQRAAIRALKEDAAPAREVYRAPRLCACSLEGNRFECRRSLTAPSICSLHREIWHVRMNSARVSLQRRASRCAWFLLCRRRIRASVVISCMENLEEGLNRLAAFVQSLEQHSVAQWNGFPVDRPAPQMRCRIMSFTISRIEMVVRNAVVRFRSAVFQPRRGHICLML